MGSDETDENVQPEQVRDLLDIVRWMFRQERNDILSTPGKLTELPEAKKRRLGHLLDVDRQVKAMLDRLPPYPPMSDEQMGKVGAVIGAALRKRFGEGSAEELDAAVQAAWPCGQPPSDTSVNAVKVAASDAPGRISHAIRAFLEADQSGKGPDE